MIRLRLKRKQLLLFILIVIAAVAVVWLFDREKKDAAAEDHSRMTLVIDPGHGGIDSGAVGADGTRESDLNLAIALKLRALAELYGQDNIMVRQDDSTKCDSEKYSEHRDLESRTEIVNAAVNPVYISIHQNDYPTAQPSGIQVIYGASRGSKDLGKITHSNMIGALYPDSRRLAEPATRKLYILSHVNCPAILIECGFVSNTIDLENLKKPGYQTSLATLMMGSYLQYLQNTIRI